MECKENNVYLQKTTMRQLWILLASGVLATIPYITAQEAMALSS